MKVIHSVSGFISAILKRKSDKDLRVTYRGHEDADYLLQPAIFRTPINQENEHRFLRELVAAHPHEFSADATTLELLVRMQHYSLPTRLLDVSWNPLVALYFSCQPKKVRRRLTRNGKRTSETVSPDGEVVILSIPSKNIRYFDSDAVSNAANMARLTLDLKRKIREVTTKEGKFDRDKFNLSTSIRRLRYYVCQEKSEFEPRITWAGLNGIYLVKPKQNNRRISAQDGAFFIFGLTDELEENNAQNITVEKIRIASKAKNTILQELDRLAFNEKTMFPELDRAAHYITRNLNDELIRELLP